METIAIKLYFYSWNIGGEQYNSALYTDERQRDNALAIIAAHPLLQDITFLPSSIELFKSDLNVIKKAFKNSRAKGFEVFEEETEQGNLRL